jgi:hypothetical protein
MNLRELSQALHVAGVDSRRYWLDGEPAKDVVDGWLDLDRDGDRWYVEGGDDVVYGSRTRLCSFTSEAEACAVFLRELMREDGKAFEAEKSAWKGQVEREWQEAEQSLAATDPVLAGQRAYWHAEWTRREAAGRPAMTAAELGHALEEAGHRYDSFIAGVDEPPRATDVRLIGPDRDDTWYVGFLDERSNFGTTLVGLTEGEACRYAYEEATRPTAVPVRLTETQWRAQRENVRYYNANHGSRPFPPWPAVQS